MLTMKGVERFQNVSVHDLCNLKALKTLKKKTETVEWWKVLKVTNLEPN